jgi:hypothetical protein
MKKILLLLFIMPICAMEKQPEEIHNALISDEEPISQTTDTVDCFDPEQICKLTLEVYSSLGKAHQDSQILLGDVSTLIAKTYSALKENKPEDAARWFAHFEERGSLDFTLLGISQRNAYHKLYCYLRDKVGAIQPEHIKKMGICERANLFKDESESWIKDIVENDTCGGTEWRTILASDDKDTVCLSPKTLRAKRIKYVETYCTIQEMKK